MFNYRGDFIANKFTSRAESLRLKNDVTTLTRFSVNEVVADGYNLHLEKLDENHYYKIKKYSGSHDILDNVISHLDVNEVEFTCNKYTYKRDSRITGIMNDINFILHSDYANFFNFVGRIQKRDAYETDINVIKSTIYLESYLTYTLLHIDMSDKKITLDNAHIIQDTPTYLLHNQINGMSFHVDKIGAIITNATQIYEGSNGTLNLNNLTPNSY